MTNKLKVACVQINTGADVNENIKATAALIRDAAEQGATLIATPEMTDGIRRYAKDKFETSDIQERYHAVKAFSTLAKELGVWLLIGSLGVRINDDKLANRSMLFAPDGSTTARYDKIHMFDVTLSRTEFYKESKDYEAGNKAVIAKCGDFTLGMGVCYDVRFPHLWRDLAKSGANILSVPAAFTRPTGQAHWEVLLRARAIETGSFVIAPAQTGEHEGGRLTYGHSMIIGPWGEILAAMKDETGIITAEINLDDVEKARSAIPALQHDKDYTLNHEQER